MPLTEVRHPLVQHKLGRLRDFSIPVGEFRALATEITRLLAYEATKDLPLEDIQIESWAGPITVKQVQGKMLTAVPILRAGLGMLDGFLDMIPGAKVSIVGMFRDESTLTPHKYYTKLAHNIEERTAFILDPMLATGGSLNATIDLLYSAGCPSVRTLSFVAAPEGIAAVSAKHPDVHMYVAAVDERLNENGYILPGLGDAGDRLFGTK